MCLNIALSPSFLWYSEKGPAAPGHDAALRPCSQAGKSIPKRQKLAATARPTKRRASGARIPGRRRRAEPGPDATQVQHLSSVPVPRGLHARSVLLQPCMHAMVPAASRLMHRHASLLGAAQCAAPVQHVPASQRDFLCAQSQPVAASISLISLTV